MEKERTTKAERNIGGKVQRWFTTILECRASCVHIFIWKQWSFVYHSTLWIFLSSLSVSGWIDVGFFLRVVVTKLQISSVGPCHSVHCAALNKPSVCGAVFALVKSRESVGVWCGFCRIPKCATVSWVCKCCERRVLFMCFIVCFWWQIFPCHCEKKERRKTPVVLLLPAVLCVFFILTLFSLQLFFTSFSVHLVSFLYFICYFKSLRPVPPILVAETSSFVVASSLLLLLGFFFSRLLLCSVSFSTTNNNNYEEVVCLYDLCVCVKILWSSATRYDDR